MRSLTNRNNHYYWLCCLASALLMLGWGEWTATAQDPGSDSEKTPVKQELKPEKTTHARSTNDKMTAVGSPAGNSAKPTAGNSAKVITDEDRAILRREDASEVDAAIMPYINNFFATARLGPEDVLTVDVFDQPIYSRSNITVPPNGKINYPLIGQVLIAGRTTDEIEKEIAEKLQEYIIDPKVTVQMVQVHSLKFMVIGDVTGPGIYEMTRRMSLTEGLAKAGYLSKWGDRNKVRILRMQPDGRPAPMKVPLKDIEKGKTQDIYLVPGDTIVVGGNLLKKFDQGLGLASLVAWMRVVVQ